MRTPADVLATVTRSDPARPRITWYDDEPGPTRGERVELSARVLGNWVSKIGNALQDEWDVEPGRAVRLEMPPHWRSIAWALGTWSVGGCLHLGGEAPAGVPDVAVTVSDDPALLEGRAEPTVLVTLPALARAAAHPLPAGTFDGARELATFPDELTPWSDPAPADPALLADGRLTAYADVVRDHGWDRGTRVHTRSTSPAVVLDIVLAALAVDGSVVLGRGDVEPVALAERLSAEGVDLDLAG